MKLGLLKQWRDAWPWALAMGAGVVGWVTMGWQGVLMAVSATVFWLLLTWSRTMRVLSQAGRRPIGLVDNAVALHTKLSPGMTLLEVIQVAGCLGQAVGEDWRWTDVGGAAVTVRVQRGRVLDWTLQRPD